jgi:uncharacterized protein YlxW (UPF0749 family)
MSEIENALAWADHKKASIVPAHTLAAEVRRLRAELASEKAKREAAEREIERRSSGKNR